MTNPTIGQFSKTEDIVLSPVVNGGWIIYRRASAPGDLPEAIGAYGSAAEMICALAGALDPDFADLDDDPVSFDHLVWPQPAVAP